MLESIFMLIGCCSNYHNNFVVQNGWRFYYPGIPEYIQVGEHQFVEQKTVKLWINMMLVGWYDSKSVVANFLTSE